MPGLIVAAMSVVCSGMQQILCGTIQRNYDVSSNQLLSLSAPIQVGGGGGRSGCGGPSHKQEGQYTQQQQHKGGRKGEGQVASPQHSCHQWATKPRRQGLALAGRGDQVLRHSPLFALQGA